MSGGAGRGLCVQVEEMTEQVDTLKRLLMHGEISTHTHKLNSQQVIIHPK